MPNRVARIAAAVAAAAVAFTLYSSTLLPGQDLGDTASFQAAAGDVYLTPRDGYPLYFAVTGAFVHALPLERAHAANLASAVLAALGVGVLALVGSRLARSLFGGLFAALLFAGSYTFWSQAIIAEVYALHMLVVSLALLALLRWADRPSTGRLAVVFFIVALGFGNHLSTVLLLPAFTVFMLLSAPGGPRAMLRPRVLLVAAVIALLCSLQYAWNLATVDPLAFQDPVELARSFWFDVTKSDWRASMVAGIPAQRMNDRLAMYWFDLRQQFGIPGAAAAAVGAVALVAARWRQGLLLVLLWAAAWGFAMTYNVGDVHVFFLPSHLVVALWAGCGAAAALALLRRAAGERLAFESVRRESLARAHPAVVLVAVAAFAYPAWRAWDTWPALDRSQDAEPRLFFDRLVSGLSPGGDVFAAELGWQQHNGMGYYARHTRPDLSIDSASPMLLHFPFFAWRNQELGRTVVLSEAAAELVRDTYGPLFSIEPDPRLQTPPLVERLGRLPEGTAYALAMLKPYREGGVGPEDMKGALEVLAGAPVDVPEADYLAVFGRVGEKPVLVEASNRPFRKSAEVEGRRLDVRMEAWLSTDTIRRAGFGHVVEGRRHLLTIDRGLSFVALGPDGEILLRTWQGGMLTPQGRFFIRKSQSQSQSQSESQSESRAVPAGPRG